MSRSVRRRRKRARERPRAAVRPVEASPPISKWFVLQMRLYAWLIPVAFCVGAVIGLDYGLSQRSLARDSKTWPITAGVVLTAEVREGGKRYTTYEPHVTYAYTVDGTRYVGHVLRVGDIGSTVGAEVVMGQRLVGTTVTVHYNPDDPGQAVLEPGGGELWRFFAGAGAVSGIVGALLLIRTARDEWLRVTYVRAERTRSSPVHDSP